MAKTALRWVQYLLTAIAVAALGYYAYVWIHTTYFQARASRQFEQEVKKHPTPPPTPHVSLPPRIIPKPPPPRNGEIIGRLSVPRLGLSVMVVQGDTAADLKRAAGHIPGTALPGQPGNVAIAGHRDTFFRPLRAIRPDDDITLTYIGGRWTYRVISTKVVEPSDVQVLYPTRQDTLTLVTCFPFYYIGAAPKRFIVRAKRLPGG